MTSVDAVSEQHALTEHVWPRNARLHDGEFVLAGVSATQLADEHGTPAFFLDESDFRERAQLFRDAFRAAFSPLGVDVDVYYAGKAFLSIAVARWAHEEGLRIDTASMGEMAVALRAGIPGDHMGLHGNNKSDEERRRAITHRVGRIVIDSPGEIDDIVRVARALGRTAADPVPVMVRVTTGIHAGGHDFIATAREDQKFGLSLAGGQALATLTAVLDHPELHLLGAHAHIGSQIQDPTAFEVNARKMLTLRADLEHATGYLMPELDLGGGYGIAYTPEETPIDVPNLAQRLATTLSEVAAELGTTIPRISIEPGRSIIGPAMVTCYRVGVVKPVVTDEGVTRLYVSVDGGMSDNIRPALYGAQYTARLANRIGSEQGALARVVGKHCESGDIIIPDVVLPADIGPGDLLVVAATGAYNRSMASNYNNLLKPPVIAVREGHTTVLVRRETEDDLLATDLG